MKNNALILTLAFAAMLTGNSAHAQINPKLYGEAEDYRIMAKRTMIVELKEEDPKLIEKLSKKEKRAGQLKEYKEFISNYNTMIKSAVEKY